MTIDLEELAAVIRLLADAEFSEFKYSCGDTVLHVRRGDLVAEPPLAAPTTVAAVPPSVVAVNPQESRVAPAATGVAPTKPAILAGTAPVEATTGTKVRAPLLGTFYSAPKPGEPPFVKVGDRVEPDTIVCVIEVMKLMASVPAGVSGTIAAIHVKDGDLVEFDQPLFTVTDAP